jgi:hypothetical protein
LADALTRALAPDSKETRMTDSGQLNREPRDDSGDRDVAAPINPALLDWAGLAQPPDEALEAVLREIAPGARQDTAEARAAQIEIDRRIVMRVRAEKFNGPNTGKLLLKAHRYAHRVTGYLIGTGQIFSECVRLGRPVKRQPGDEVWTEEDRAYLTETCVDTGIFQVFLECGLKQGRWDPSRHTTLTTYAVNACTLCFPAIYQRWRRGRVLERSFGDLAIDLPAHLQVSHQPDPAEQAANRVDAERLLRRIPEPARTGLRLRGTLGFTQAEAAELLGLTEKQLEREIGQARKNLGLTRSRTPKADQDRATAPEPEADLDTQEDDRDRQG